MKNPNVILDSTVAQVQGQAKHFMWSSEPHVRANRNPSIKNPMVLTNLTLYMTLVKVKSRIQG